jgi:hypothetical protein
MAPQFVMLIEHPGHQTDNIVLDRACLRIIDLGLSRTWNADQPAAGVVRGTPFFAWPEQLIRPSRGWDTPALAVPQAPELVLPGCPASLSGCRRLVMRGVPAVKPDQQQVGLGEVVPYAQQRLPG